MRTIKLVLTETEAEELVEVLNTTLKHIDLCGAEEVIEDLVEVLEEQL